MKGRNGDVAETLPVPAASIWSESQPQNAIADDWAIAVFGPAVQLPDQVSKSESARDSRFPASRPGEAMVLPQVSASGRKPADTPFRLASWPRRALPGWVNGAGFVLTGAPLLPWAPSLFAARWPRAAVCGWVNFAGNVMTGAPDDPAAAPLRVPGRPRETCWGCAGAGCVLTGAPLLPWAPSLFAARWPRAAVCGWVNFAGVVGPVDWDRSAGAALGRPGLPHRDVRLDADPSGSHTAQMMTTWPPAAARR